jgi:hypothetical protein
MREGGTRGSRRSVIVRSAWIGPSRKAPCSPLHVNPHLVRAPLQDRDARERSRVDVSRPTLRRSTFPFSHRPPSQSSAPRPRTRARVYTSLPMAAGKGSSPFLSPPPLGRFLSTGSSSGGESFSSDAYLGRPASPSPPSAAGPSRAAIDGAKDGTPPLDLYRLMRRLSTSSSSLSASSSFRSAPRSTSASEGESEATGSSEGSFVWLAVVRPTHLEGREDVSRESVCLTAFHPRVVLPLSSVPSQSTRTTWLAS